MKHDGMKCPRCGDFDLGDWCSHCDIPTVPMFPKEDQPGLSWDQEQYPREEIESQGLTITLPDGFNGHVAKFFIVPIEEGETVVKLRLAEDGRKFMFKWVHRSDYEAAMKKAGFEIGGTNGS